MRKSGINLEQVKKENRALIIKCINDNGPLSRKDIAEKTGLTAASVTQITTSLIADNILLEVGSVHESSGTAGRKKILLDINASLYLVLSINIESENTSVVICNMKGEAISDILTLPTDSSLAPCKFLDLIGQRAIDMINKLSRNSHKRLSCASVGIPGIVDKQNGISVHAYGIWNEPVNIREILGKALDLDILVTNNVNAFATAEILLGTGRFYDSLLVIKWGPGVGSTIVIDGKVYEGRHGKTAELGHFIVQKDGKKCSCGRRGCLETIVSFRELSRMINSYDQSPDPENFEKAYLNATGDIKIRLDDAIDIFARSIVNTSTIIAPNRIVLSGSMFRGETVRTALIKACEKYDSSYNSKRILYTPLSEKENYIGPVAVYIEKLLTT